MLIVCYFNIKLLTSLLIILFWPCLSRARDVNNVGNEQCCHVERNGTSLSVVVLRSSGWTIAQWQAEVISLTGTVKFHSLNLFDFWEKCEDCLTAGYTVACKRVTEGVPQHPKIKQKVQAARPLWLKDVACDSWTKKRSTGISVCRDLLRTFQSWKVCDRTTIRRINDNRLRVKQNKE